MCIRDSLGTFLEEEHQRKILAEVLEVNGERVFERTQDLKIENLKIIKDYLSDITEQNAESVNEIAKNSLNQEELFLTNGFKLIFSPKFTKLMVDWFTNCLLYTSPTHFGLSLPEVTEVRNNEDGTIVLTIHAVCDLSLIHISFRASCR